jgi:xylulokinase
MPERCVIGIDIGTQGTKAALYDEAGACLATAFEPSRLRRPGPGLVEEDPERQVGSARRTIRACLARSRVDPRAVAGIGIDGQMAGLIGVGRDGRAVTPYDSWLDVRCAPYIERMARRAGDAVLRRTGHAPSYNHGPKILWWMRERPRTYRAVAAFVQPGGYAAMQLCGLGATEAFIDTTYLHFSGFADNRRARWDESLCRRFGLDPAKLPRIVSPESVVGGLAPAAARRCGLPAGVPVVAGCGDTAASFLACGAVREGIAVDVAGTASVFAATTRNFRHDAIHRTLGCGRAVAPGLWHPYAYINGGGMNLEWFRDAIGAGAAASRARLDLRGWDRRIAAIRPAAGLPLFVPHLGGRVCPPEPCLRGAWVGLTWDHGVAHLYRAVLEAVALEYGLFKRIAEAMDPALRLREVRVTGGGERSEAWNRIKADVLGVPILRVERNEGAPRGAALLARWGVGLFPDLAAAADRWTRTTPACRPDPSRAAYYRERLDHYARLVDALGDWSDAR